MRLWQNKRGFGGQSLSTEFYSVISTKNELAIITCYALILLHKVLVSFYGRAVEGLSSLLESPGCGVARNSCYCSNGYWYCLAISYVLLLLKSSRCRENCTELLTQTKASWQVSVVLYIIFSGIIMWSNRSTSSVQPSHSDQKLHVVALPVPRGFGARYCGFPTFLALSNVLKPPSYAGYIRTEWMRITSI